MRKDTLIHLYNADHGIIYQAPITGIPSYGATFLSDLFFKLSLICFGLGTLAVFIYFLPLVSYLIPVSNEEATAAKVLAETVANPDSSLKVVKSNYQPRFNPALPKDNKLVIPSIGVNTTVEEAISDNYEEALKKGVWRVSDFGTPEAREKPVILAAHRYGYILWSNLFRRKSSFYNLPNLQVGNTVEIDWGQRKYIYEVYKEEKGETISDYSADLILYTCESLNSPIRIFRYARLLEI